ncbi:MAG TPA: SDR family oxidoreductase [Acidimicrobiales bacterium]|nr:SDR family oxidoreductase [Acidimicrobiales bacterium]
MELADRICVVTGGASGIGRALSLRFAAEGARAVVVVDRDADGARATAEAIGDRGVADTADVTVEADIAAVVERTEAELGPIDLFASNAGILSGQGIEAGDEVWGRVWSVNLMAHVYASRALVPRMLARGGGYLLNTASAAGLLSQPGDAAYSVTKHAAVALAEWLAITYGDQGIKVSCLCPMAVATPMIGSANGDPPSGGARAAAVQGILSPDAVADAVVEGLRDERFLILPHPEVAAFEQRRAADHDRWLAGMRRLAGPADGGIVQPTSPALGGRTPAQQRGLRQHSTATRDQADQSAEPPTMPEDGSPRAR